MEQELTADEDISRYVPRFLFNALRNGLLATLPITVILYSPVEHLDHLLLLWRPHILVEMASQHPITVSAG